MSKRWFAVGSFVLLVLLAALTVAVQDSPGADLVLCALVAAWLLGLSALPPAWHERGLVMVGYFAVLLVLTAALVIRAPWFGFFTPVVYVHAFRLVPWPWQLAAVGAVSVVAGTAQAYAVEKTTAIGLATYGAVVAANVIPMCVYAWIARQNAVLQERLLVQARTMAVQDERQRMAREIHDTLAQGLTGIVSQLRAAEHADDDPVARRRHVDAATKLARESLSEARRSVHALRPEPLRSAGLGEALAGVAERWSALHQIPVQVTTTGATRLLHPEAEVALLRIAQEALANVAKHARATRVGVTLSYLEHETALDVRDDGSGFDVTATAPDRGGFGLVAMRQRVEGLSGTLEVESEPGAGTGISARVPAQLPEVCA